MKSEFYKSNPNTIVGGGYFEEVVCRQKDFYKDLVKNKELSDEVKMIVSKILESIEIYEKQGSSREKGLCNSNYGVCLDFSNLYTKFCGHLNLPCESIRGSIDSENVNVAHQWNAIIIGDEIYHVDISSAIHCKDGSNNNTGEDFFGTYNDLCNVEGNKNRKMHGNQSEKIERLKSMGKNVK